MNTMPDFQIREYRKILLELTQSNHKFVKVSGLKETIDDKKLVVLRHDIDLHPIGVLEMARLEHEMGVCSTYFCLLSAHYNPRSKACTEVLKELIMLGHEVGLHYDLMYYPNNRQDAVKQLINESDMLAGITGIEVKSISCHHPHMQFPDFFKESDHYVHCHDPRYTSDILYVSDSSRAWRDDNLIKYMEGKFTNKRGIQLLTHPESWLAKEPIDRLDYIQSILIPMICSESNIFCNEVVKKIWTTHEAIKLHDKLFSK